MKAHQNFDLKSRYLKSELDRHQGYIDALRNAISQRIKKQGERRLEKSLARSTTSLHRAESEGNLLLRTTGKSLPQGPNGEKGFGEQQVDLNDDENETGGTPNGEGKATITNNMKGLAIDDGGIGRKENGWEEDSPRTPLARSETRL